MPKDSEAYYEAGSYNMHAVSGLNAALKWIKEEGRSKIYAHKKELTDNLICRLEEIDGIEIYIPEDLENHIGVVSFNIGEYSAEDLGKILSDEYNISVRTGHHCAPLLGEFLDGYAIDGNVRISIGYFNNSEEIDTVSKVIEDILIG